VKRYLVGFVLGLASILALAPITGVGQTTTTAPYTPPRTPEGQPDLQGVWQAINTAAEDLEAHNGRLGVPAGQGVVEGGVIPYRPEALAKRKENFEKRFTRPITHELNETTGDPEAKCYLPGIPRATYMGLPFQIIQTANNILMSYEFASATRMVYLDRKPEPPANSWMGWSIGKWEGDTLVIDVTAQTDKTWFDRAGNFHSDAIHVVERYTPVSPYHLMYEATIEDPKVFTRPWKIRMPLYKRVEADIQPLEFKCVEFSEEFIYGHLVNKPGQ